MSISRAEGVTSPPLQETGGVVIVGDLFIVAAVSLGVFVIEGFAFAQGWLGLGDEARGVFSVLVGAVTAVWLVLARGGSLADLGFKRPRRWALVPLQVLIILLAFAVLQAVLPIVLSPFVELPAPDMSRHSEVVGNVQAALFMALVLPLTASIPEEIIYRGFLVQRLAMLFGSSVSAGWLAVLLQALVFGAIHFQWGVGGMLMTFAMGLVWGAAFLLCDRNLWVVILAHSTGHLVLVTQWYLDKPLLG